MGWLWLVGSIKLHVSFAKETYKRGNIMPNRPIIDIRGQDPVMTYEYKIYVLYNITGHDPVVPEEDKIYVHL